MMIRTLLIAVCIPCLMHTSIVAQDTVNYVGTALSSVDYHHGQLSPVIGTHNIQVFRANRENPAMAGNHGWTYNHQPMLAYWNNTFFMEYLSNPVGEHIAPGETLLQTSKDGYSWADPVVVFPPYKVPDGWRKKDYPGVAKDLYAVMHQRMGFYKTKNNRLLMLAYYGIAMDEKDDPNDGKGIGRVVREVLADGKFGPIYFIRFNTSFDQKKAGYPFYKKSRDKAFIAACDELLALPLMMQQWAEEADRDDPLIPLKRGIKAFSYYHLPDKRVVGLWKHALTSISEDEGKTWKYDAVRAPGFVNSNAKIWGQKTSDNRYATVYNPSEFRWPLAVSTSDNGVVYHDLLLLNGEISPMRYGGNYKSYGPQYPRGILEGNGIPIDNNMWVSYSMNKEDMWITKIPVPITSKVNEHVDDVFEQMSTGNELAYWNIFSPLWASAKIEKMNDGVKALTLRDKDPYDYAKAERVIPSSKKVKISFSIIPAQNTYGLLHIECLDKKGLPALRLILDGDGSLKNKSGYRNSGLSKYAADSELKIELTVDVKTRSYQVTVNGEERGTKLFFAPVAAIDRVAFRTGNVRRFPDADTPTDQDYDLKNAGEPVQEAIYYIKSFKSEPIR